MKSELASLNSREMIEEKNLFVPGQHVKVPISAIYVNCIQYKFSKHALVELLSV